MTATAQPGHFATLTADEEAKLKEVWAHMLRFWGTPVTQPSGTSKPKRSNTVSSVNTKASKDSAADKGGKKKLFGKFRKGHAKGKSSDKNDLTLTTTRSRESIEDSYTHKMIHESLQDLKPEEIYENFWNMLRADTPDNLVLRFVRARKWDTDKALAMFAHTLHWRLKERNVDQLLFEGDRKPFENGVDGFILQLKKNKAYFRGTDKEGRPIVHIRPRLHHSNEQTLEEIEDYTLLVIEICRLILEEPTDSASILFDLTGFSMANMDYAPVKFMIGVFEAHYPESLGRLFIHKAPWIFPPIWNIIKNWLDPVVASKIVFTKNIKDLEKHIERNFIPKELEGGDDFEPVWTEPNPEDDKLLEDTATRDEIKAERNAIVKKFIGATVAWIESTTPEESNKWKAEKATLGKELAENYIKLDPYIRSRNTFDRMGCVTIKPPAN